MQLSQQSGLMVPEIWRGLFLSVCLCIHLAACHDRVPCKTFDIIVPGGEWGGPKEPCIRCKWHLFVPVYCKVV